MGACRGLCGTWFAMVQCAPTVEKPRNTVGRPARSLGSIVAGFKAAVTRRCREDLPEAPQRIWQRNYYDHIIRTSEELHEIRQYIRQNPMRYNIANRGMHPGMETDEHESKKQ
jgi:hypothetical protein